jgi:hypothetical protein
MPLRTSEEFIQPAHRSDGIFRFMHGQIHMISTIIQIRVMILGNFEHGGRGMQFKITQYEVKYLGENQWQKISEKTCMEFLVDIFDPLTPILADMLNGQEIRTPYAIWVTP